VDWVITKASKKLYQLGEEHPLVEA